MEVEIFTLCDYAQDMNGKLTIVGTFDVIGSPVFPYTHPHCAIASRLRFSDKEVGKHKGCITFKDQNNEVVVPNLEFDITVNRPDFNGHSTVNIVLNLANHQFKSPDKFAIELYIDDEWRTGLNLNLLQVKNAA